LEQAGKLNINPCVQSCAVKWLIANSSNNIVKFFSPTCPNVILIAIDVHNYEENIL